MDFIKTWNGILRPGLRKDARFRNGMTFQELVDACGVPTSQYTDEDGGCDFVAIYKDFYGKDRDLEVCIVDGVLFSSWKVLHNGNA